ncbi:siderophore-interacting protein [Paractinoplanes lichenicola]|uniref:Siderophore-interacting protein n=1 Tax=Paractinoplanes lichenicola TaxID=2802976 RepID=A0ABS1W617_9ACTN|nr:hypothetical protein [Actinoplanes lichenicola]MBL7262157.1 hypothetical protein [Actinoplanes lichenicola]
MTAPRPSRLVSALLDISTREAEVERVEQVGPRFRLISLAVHRPAMVSWTPGDMVQLIVSGAALRGPWELRSYTPLAREPLTILWYVHGNGPGSGWGETASVGMGCRFVGPRHALTLSKPARPVVFFGDETSFSTALAMRETPAGYRDVRFVLEVDSVTESRAVLDRCGLGGAVTLVGREEGDWHLGEAERAVAGALGSSPAARGILTGKATSIQRIYKAVRAAGVPGRRVTNVPYWAPGRTGLKGH